MTEYAIDFSDVQSTRYLQPGIYNAVVEGIEEREGRQAPLFVWTFCDDTGARSTITTSLSAAALWKLQEVLTAFGVDATGRMKLSLAKLKRLIGRPAIIEVAAEEGADGKTYSKITRVMPAGPREVPKPVAAPVSAPRAGADIDVDFDSDDLPF